MPYTDRHTRYDPAAPIDGFRSGLLDGIVNRCPPLEAGDARAGYLLALYGLRNSALPPAFMREADIARLQDVIARACSLLNGDDVGRNEQ